MGKPEPVMLRTPQKKRGQPGPSECDSEDSSGKEEPWPTSSESVEARN